MSHPSLILAAGSLAGLLLLAACHQQSSSETAGSPLLATVIAGFNRYVLVGPA